MVQLTNEIVTDAGAVRANSFPLSDLKDRAPGLTFVLITQMRRGQLGALLYNMRGAHAHNNRGMG